jgi:hypothetical protein
MTRLPAAPGIFSDAQGLHRRNWRGWNPLSPKAARAADIAAPDEAAIFHNPLRRAARRCAVSGSAALTGASGEDREAATTRGVT